MNLKDNLKKLSDTILDATPDPSYLGDVGMPLMLMPHRRLAKDDCFVTEYLGYKWTFRPLIRPGDHTQLESRIGHVHGSVGRIVLFHILERAAASKCPEIALGKTWTDWFAETGITIRRFSAIRAVEEQTMCIVSSSISFSVTKEVGLRGSTHSSNMLYVGAFQCGRLGYPWEARLVLSSEVFASLLNKPLPIRRRDLLRLAPSSYAMQIYAWMAYCLPNLEREIFVPWGQLFAQFRGDYRDKAVWRRHFLISLQSVKAVYGAARVVVTEPGLKLTPSPSPITHATRLRLIS